MLLDDPVRFVTYPIKLQMFICCVVPVQATWMAYDMVVMRTNPDLANSMRRLEDAFLTCKEEMEKNWREMLKETKSVAQKQE